jgi:hypothetical protein
MMKMVPTPAKSHPPISAEFRPWFKVVHGKRVVRLGKGGFIASAPKGFFFRRDGARGFFRRSPSNRDSALSQALRSLSHDADPIQRRPASEIEKDKEIIRLNEKRLLERGLKPEDIRYLLKI